MTTTQETKVLHTLVGILVRTKITGTNPIVSEYDLSSDGRRRKRILKELIEEGHVEKKPESNLYFVTDKVLETYAIDNFIQSPDLVGRLKDDTYHLGNIANGNDFNDYHSHGIPFGSLPVEQKIYIAQHMDKFKFRYFSYGKVRDFTPGEAYERNDTLCVSTEEYDEFVEATRFEGRVIRSFNANVTWGLNALCGVSEEDATLALRGSDGSVRLPSQSSNGPVKLANPAAKVKEAAEKMLANIAYATRRYDAISRVNKAVALYGGWAQFESDLIKNITETLKAEDAGEVEESRV